MVRHWGQLLLIILCCMTASAGWSIAQAEEFSAINSEVDQLATGW